MTSAAAVAFLASVCVTSSCIWHHHAKTPPAAPAGLEVLWQRDITTPDDARSPWIAASESSVFFAGPEIGLAAHAASDGAAQWTSAHKSIVAPVVTGAGVFIASDREVLLLKPDQDAVVWRADTATPARALFAAGERLGALVESGLVAWDRSGGRAWQTPLRASPSTPVVFANGMLFVGLENATLAALDAATGSERWRITLPAKPESLAAAGDQLFLSTVEAHLYGYPATGENKHRWDFPKIRTIGQPVIDDAQVYFALLDNAVHAYERNGGSERWNAAFPDRPVGGPLKIAGGLAVALLNGEVLRLTTAGHVVHAAVPPKIPASTSLQWAVTSADGTRIFTVTTTPDQKRVLTAWGEPSLRVSGK